MRCYDAAGAPWTEGKNLRLKKKKQTETFDLRKYTEKGPSLYGYVRKYKAMNVLVLKRRAEKGAIAYQT